MAGSTYGTLFRITTWGESHGPALGVVIDGCPSGLSLSEEDILSKSNISIGKLIKLEAELEFELMFTKGENTSLTDKLDELKREYLIF